MWLDASVACVVGCSFAVFLSGCLNWKRKTDNGNVQNSKRSGNSKKATQPARGRQEEPSNAAQQQQQLQKPAVKLNKQQKEEEIWAKKSPSVEKIKLTKSTSKEKQNVVVGPSSSRTRSLSAVRRSNSLATSKRRRADGPPTPILKPSAEALPHPQPHAPDRPNPEDSPESGLSVSDPIEVLDNILLTEEENLGNVRLVRAIDDQSEYHRLVRRKAKRLAKAKNRRDYVEKVDVEEISSDDTLKGIVSLRPEKQSKRLTKEQSGRAEKEAVGSSEQGTLRAANKFQSKAATAVVLQKHTPVSDTARKMAQLRRGTQYDYLVSPSTKA